MKQLASILILMSSSTLSFAAEAVQALEPETLPLEAAGVAVGFLIAGLKVKK